MTCYSYEQHVDQAKQAARLGSPQLSETTWRDPQLSDITWKDTRVVNPANLVGESSALSMLRGRGLHSFTV